jgi:hypothetical protein
MPGGSEAPVRYVFKSENGFHAVKVSGLSGVDAQDAPVRNGAPDIFGIQHARHAQVVGVARPPGDLCHGIFSPGRFTYSHIFDLLEILFLDK